MLIRSN